MYAIFQRTILFAAGFTVPLQATQWSIGGYPVSITKAVVALLMVLIGMQLISPSHRRLPPDRALPMLILFAASVLVSGFVALAHGQPLWFVFAGSAPYFGLVLFYVALLLAVRSRKELVFVLWGMALGGALAGFPALIQASQGTLFVRGSRLQGLAGQANTLAYELTIAVAVLAGLYFSVRAFAAKLLLLGAGFVILLAIIGSLSRSAFGALVIMWGFWLFRSGRLDILRYALPAVAVAGILYLFLPAAVHDRMSTVIDPAQRRADAGALGRIDQAKWATRALLSNPVAGIGNGNFLPWVKRQPGGHLISNTIHNSFFYVMATQGLLGLIPFLSLHFLAWRDYTSALRLAAARRKRSDPLLRELRTYALFLQIALLGSIVGGMAHQESASKGLWILFALSASVLHLARVRATELDATPAASAEDLRSSLPYRTPVDAAAPAG